MQLTGKQIVNKQIITGYVYEGVQQQGIDVRLNRIAKVNAGNKKKKKFPVGVIPAEGKTTLPSSEWFAGQGDGGIFLEPGYYEVEFMEGCNIPEDCAMQFKTRSSLVRCGADIRSGQFDAGFKTEHMGAYMKVELPMVIEMGARVAQTLIFRTEKVTNTYNGQWQEDKQRRS